MIDASVVINMLDDPDDLAILEEALCPASEFRRKASEAIWRRGKLHAQFPASRDRLFGLLHDLTRR